MLILNVELKELKGVNAFGMELKDNSVLSKEPPAKIYCLAHSALTPAPLGA